MTISLRRQYTIPSCDCSTPLHDVEASVECSVQPPSTVYRSSCRCLPLDDFMLPYYRRPMEVQPAFTFAEEIAGESKDTLAS